MSDQVAPPSAPDAAAPQPAVETPQPTPAQPQAATSDAAEPLAAKPGTADPQAAKPEAADPQAAKPEAADPQAAASGATDPQAAKPEAADPQAATSDAAVPPATATATAEPEAKKSGTKKALSIVGAILAIVVVAGLKFGLASAIGGYFNKDETADAKAGDCIAELPEITGTKQEKVDGAKVVECTSTDAAYTVVGRVNDQSEAQAKAGTACDSFFQNDEEGYIFSSIEPGKSGYVLCLTKKA
ncbi:LppU/SCO3897 family protein [Micromonospora zamorensis]|uniref:LppU/SCO3897 family protein n=1 Tax=Micromonospora zamorensis TaxID=709883 RepID=UPI0033F40730